MRIRLALLTVISCIALSCGGGGDDPRPPVAPKLLFPENNSECETGVVDPVYNNLSTIEFRWEESANTNNYELRVTQLNSGDTKVEFTTGTALELQLQRGEPYSWSVNALSNNFPDQDAASATWKFYNAGEGITAYAPFPAELLSPRSGATLDLPNGSVTLQWKGADVDEDIVSYEIHLDRDNPPTQIVGTTSNQERFTVEDLEADIVYYWQVITTDSRDNSSVSEVAQFKISN